MKEDGTRERILAAARDVAVEQGFGAFTIEKVAEQAGVSRMTVYYQFGAKPQLMEALFDWIAEQGGMGALREAFHARDPVAGLARFIETFCGFWDSDRVGLRRLRGWMAAEDPSDEPRDGRDAWRREGLQSLLRRIAEKRDETIDEEVLFDTVDVLHNLTSFETYDRLAARGRSRDEVADLLYRAALALLELEASADETAA